MSDVHRLDHAELDRAARVLDDLGARRHRAYGVDDDPLLAALADWTTAIDTATSARVIRPARVSTTRLAPVRPLVPAVAASRGGRHRVVRRTVGGTLLTAMALAGSSVAAALSGGHVPVLTDLGTALVDVVPMLDSPVDVTVRVSPPRVDTTSDRTPVGAPADGSTPLTVDLVPLTVDLVSLSTPSTAEAPPDHERPGAEVRVRDGFTPADALGARRGPDPGRSSADPTERVRAPHTGTGEERESVAKEVRPPAGARPLVPPQLWLSPPPGLAEGEGRDPHGRVDRPDPLDGALRPHGQSGEPAGPAVGRPGHAPPVDVPRPPATHPATAPCGAATVVEPPPSGARESAAPPVAPPPTRPPVEAGPSCEVGAVSKPPADVGPPAEAEPPAAPGPPATTEPAPPPAEGQTAPAEAP